MLLIVPCALLICGACCAPTDVNSDTIKLEKESEVEEKQQDTSQPRSDVNSETTGSEVEEGKQQDTPEASTQKNPVQEWFENLSKDTSNNAQNALNNIKEFFSKLSTNNNVNQGGAASNLPVMFVGSFQLLKMPMPQIGDVIKGMGDLATAAQAVNKLTSGLPLPIPGLQG